MRWPADWLVDAVMPGLPRSIGAIFVNFDWNAAVEFRGDFQGDKVIGKSIQA